MFRLFRRNRGATSAAASVQPVGRWNLSLPVLRWSDSDILTLAQACTGIQIFGGTGSGKTSGSLATIIRAYLTLGFGGIFFTVKPTDRQDYERYCRECGRENDLIVFGPGEPWSFNFLDAELRRTDAAGSLTDNIAALLMNVLEVAERHSGKDGREDAGFWQRMTRQLLKNAIELLVQATGSLSVSDLYRLIISAPVSVEQISSIDWQRNSFCYQCLTIADRRSRTPRQTSDYRLAADYFLIEWVQLSERTRSVVLSSLSSALDTLQRGVARELLSSAESNISPEATQQGKIIVIDLPILVWGAVGQFVQVIWKYCLQKCQERRDIQANGRPVFMVADESHLLYVSSDQLFQTTARSSRTLTVYATQSISNYLSALGGDKAEAEIHSLAGNLQVQIFHQNLDVRTNTYASELIGRTRQYFFNGNQSSSGPPDLFGVVTGLRDETRRQQSGGFSEQMEFEVQPSEFAALRQGGPPHWYVDAIVVQGGKAFRSSGRPWCRVAFRQKF